MPGPSAREQCQKDLELDFLLKRACPEEPKTFHFWMAEKMSKSQETEKRIEVLQGY